MACVPIYSFSAPEGKYLEPATSSHPIKDEGYAIYPDFISLVRELNFARGSEENPYKNLQNFKEICATLMISVMNHETLKWKAFPFLLMGRAKQWYKLHVSSCHGNWVILNDQFCFPFFLLSKIIDLRSDVISFRSNLVSIQATRHVGSRVVYPRCYVHAAFCAWSEHGVC
jgi:hypothetical protein